MVAVLVIGGINAVPGPSTAQDDKTSQEVYKNNVILTNLALTQGTSCTSALPLPLILWLRLCWQLLQLLPWVPSALR